MKEKNKKIFLFLGIFLASFLVFSPVFAHRSGCHRWHSCPSDSGSYTCGDLGHPCQYPTYPASGGVIYPPSGYYKDCYDCPLKKVPGNAYTSGISWSCNSGYKKVGDTCQEVVAPANAYIIGSDWYCNNGYKRVGNRCEKIIVLNSSDNFLPSFSKIQTEGKSDSLYKPPKYNPSNKKYNVRYNKNITIYTQKFDLRDSVGGIIKSENGKTIYTVDKSGCLKSIKNLQVIKRMYGDSWSSYMSVVDDKVLKEYEFCGVVEE